MGISSLKQRLKRLDEVVTRRRAALSGRRRCAVVTYQSGQSPEDAFRLAVEGGLDPGGYLLVPAAMTSDEWNRIAPKQQQELTSCSAFGLS
ncbi:hypothetical protein GCM10027034_20180 [Ramlibacter solisilvae]|uniref:Uncharacterized protein n=1 Tax=Ramlibacter tataouinensis TaxID=94132 RepID=A0A127JV69_9BURK|nr:hypothetical protein UC35_14850 [Ramlibacter tataouinensis]